LVEVADKTLITFNQKIEHMKILIVISFIISVFNSKTPEKNRLINTQPGYKKSDLKKIKWIEGKWKGLYEGKPFYEIYQFVNDSTLQITSYDWNGKDSSNSSVSHVYWKDGSYYLGSDLNWKVSAISDNEIKMLPNYKAYNDILWRNHDSKSWKAILTSKKGVNEYHMEAFDPFK
jgi:hypothetical protein